MAIGRGWPKAFGSYGCSVSSFLSTNMDPRGSMRRRLSRIIDFFGGVVAYHLDVQKRTVRADGTWDPSPRVSALVTNVGGLVGTLGHLLLVVSGHVATTPDAQAEYTAPFYESFVSLAWMAGSTSRAEPGTTVTILPYRHPLQVASMPQTIDRLSNCRFIPGVGVGRASQEFAAPGVPFEKHGAMAEDYLAAPTEPFQRFAH